MQWNCTSIGLCSTKKTNQWLGGGAWAYGFAAASQISSLQRRRPRFLLFADTEIHRWNASAAGLDLLQRPACKFGLSPAGIRRRPKRASLKEQISARLCCKCCTVIVRRAGLPWTLMTLTLRACHAWGNPTLTLCSAGVDCSHWEFSLASLRSRIAFFSEARPGKVYVWETLRKVRTAFWRLR